jgi:signal transduction histidine kinase
MLSPRLSAVEQQLAVVEKTLAALPPEPLLQSHAHIGYHSGFAKSADSTRWVQLDLGAEYPVDAVVLVPATLGDGRAFGFPMTYKVETGLDSELQNAECLADVTDRDGGLSPLPRSHNGRGRKARFVRLTVTGLASQPRARSRFVFCLGEVLVFSGGRNVALGGGVETEKRFETPPTWSAQHLVDGIYAPGVASVPASAMTNGWHSAIFSDPSRASWVQVDLGGKYRVDEVRLIPAHPPDFPDRAGFGFPLRFKIEASLGKDFSDAVLLADHTNADYQPPGDVPVVFKVPGVETRYLRVTATRLWERTKDYVFALSELQVNAGGGNVALHAPVESSDSTATGGWMPRHLVDGIGGAGTLVEEAGWLADLNRRRELLQERELLERQRSGLLAKMRGSLSLGTALILVGVVGGALAHAWRSHRRRRTEVEALRSQFARDLHDEIGSNLSSIRLMTEMACRQNKGGSDTNTLLRDIQGVAVESTEALRDIVRLYREGGMTEPDAVVEQMRRCARTLLLETEWNLESSSEPGARAVAFGDAREVLAILREALHNCARHSRARNVRIRVRWSRAGVELEMRDDGRGFDTGQASQGHGIGNMRERAKALAGSLEIASTPGAGTILSLRAPLQ